MTVEIINMFFVFGKALNCMLSKSRVFCNSNNIWSYKTL